MGNICSDVQLNYSDIQHPIKLQALVPCELIKPHTYTDGLRLFISASCGDLLEFGFYSYPRINPMQASDEYLKSKQRVRS